jgi:hypothetical protein
MSGGSNDDDDPTTNEKSNCLIDDIPGIDTPHSVFWGPGVQMRDGGRDNGSRRRCTIEAWRGGKGHGYCRERGPKKEIAFYYDCSKADKHGDKCTITHEDGMTGGEVSCINGKFNMTKEPERISASCDGSNWVNNYATHDPLTNYLKAEEWNCRNATNEGEECEIIRPWNGFRTGKITCTNGWYTITPGVWRG